ncbi:MAG: TonB-dependent receptor, partial [Hydrogenimonas sp.]|nr:TonB-dependent receptor [Hydrogenimonas sp.]
AHNWAKIAYYTSFNRSWSLSFIGRYVGSKKRAWYDYRDDKVPSYKTLDTTLGYKKNGFNMKLSVKNIFDEDVRYPSEPYNYDGDFPADGRTVMFTLTKAF